MEAEKEVMRNVAANRSDNGSGPSEMIMGRPKPTSQGSSEEIESKGLLEQQQLANFSKQVDTAEGKANDKRFEYYRAAATTPYIPISRLQGL